jgi:methyltransferase (TIGR00027 family)
MFGTGERPYVRDISETAHWAAVYRAHESNRRDALFRDPFADLLVGDRRTAVRDGLPFGNRISWSLAVRTFLIDKFVRREIQCGADMVINLAAGFDTRPYRMALPASLRWIEVDFPQVLRYKNKALRNERPSCALDRIPLDLAEVDARRDLFRLLGRKARKALVITEGLLIYLNPRAVASLAHDLSTSRHLKRWVLDLASPPILHAFQRQVGEEFRLTGASLRFGPENGPAFFMQYGWQPIAVRSVIKTAERFDRLPARLRGIARTPEFKGREGPQPWSGVYLFAKQ